MQIHNSSPSKNILNIFKLISFPSQSPDSIPQPLCISNLKLCFLISEIMFCFGSVSYKMFIVITCCVSVFDVAMLGSHCAVSAAYFLSS